MQLTAIHRRSTVELVVDRIARVIKERKLASTIPDAAESPMHEHMQAVVERLEKLG
ncbi:MAG: hypothetical protein ABL921_10285 [Pirellula sp.]